MGWGPGSSNYWSVKHSQSMTLRHSIVKFASFCVSLCPKRDVPQSVTFFFLFRDSLWQTFKLEQKLVQWGNHLWSQGSSEKVTARRLSGWTLASVLKASWSGCSSVFRWWGLSFQGEVLPHWYNPLQMLTCMLASPLPQCYQSLYGTDVYTHLHPPTFLLNWVLFKEGFNLGKT